MAGSASHLVDRVLPSVPLRQYVLAFPYELSGLAATRPEVLAALSRIFWESLRLHYQGWAKAAGHATSGRVETGAVTGVHRAGASLNVHVHFHLLCLDGVYVDDGEALRFEPAPAPTRAELTSMLQRIYGRVMSWLSRRGLLRDPDDAHDSNAAREGSPAEALATAGMQRGNLVTVRERDDGEDDDEPSLRRRHRACASTPSRTSASTCAPAYTSKPTPTSDASDSAATSTGRPSRSRASAYGATATSRTA